MKSFSLQSLHALIYTSINVTTKTYYIIVYTDWLSIEKKQQSNRDTIMIYDRHSDKLTLRQTDV